MTTTVTPDTFRFVSFDADEIRRIADSMIDSLGMSGRDVRIEVDETTPLGRASVEVNDDVVTIRVESGAFEDTRRPRQQSESAVATTIGRLLLRVRDRTGGGFGEAPPDEELTLAQVAAWEAYSIGRLERVGVATNQQRWRYNFRNRHGFSDASDAAFDRLWSSEGLAWGELEEISRTAAAPSGAAAAD